MATVYLQRARKPTAVGPFRIGYANLSVPYLDERKHVVTVVGPAILRMGWSEAKRYHAHLGELLSKYNGEK